MGKKILVDAGYDVLTVSNGLEALRKIADTIPDIAILDIFMPGYTGLEICERLRANAATAALPVILTVGKLEPYRPEDGEHVHSNAVIVKPFAAAELVSAVHSLIGPPVSAVESAPEFATPALRDIGPLHDSGTASADSLAIDPPTLRSAESGGTPQQDEPLRFQGSSAAYDDASPVTPQGSITYGAPPLFENDSDGPESLIFNPDAAHTPFSASATDILPSLSGFPAESGAPALAEFALAPGASDYSAGAGISEEYAFQDELSVGPEVGSGATFPEPTMSSESSCLENPPLDAPSLEVSPLGPSPLETLQVDAFPGDPLLMSDDFDVRRPAIETTADVPVQCEGFPTSGAVTSQDPSNEEEERRRAFEALFNATDPIPMEEAPSVFAGGSLETLPNIAELSKDQDCDVPHDSELEPLHDEIESEFIAPAADPYLMHEEEERSRIAAIPEHDPLLEDSFEVSWPPPADTLEPMEGDAVASSYAIDSVSENTGYLASASTFSSPVAEQGAEDAHSVPLPEPAPLAPLELGDPTPTPEAAFHEVVSEQMEATLPAPDFDVLQTAPESDHLKSEIHPAELESHLADTEPGPAQREPGPEPHSAIAPLNSTQVEQDQTEANAATIGTSPEMTPQLSEAERIHQAVEQVFERFKPLLVAAIVRQLLRHD
jgi:CheY-like chemotaxis protein